jgi:hypothetical protein
LLLVTLTFTSGPPKTTELEPFFNQATDWYRYAPNCWLVWTTGTAHTWYPYLKAQISPSDYLFIVEVTGLWRGWIPQGAVDWLKKYGAVSFP